MTLEIGGTGSVPGQARTEAARYVSQLTSLAQQVRSGKLGPDDLAVALGKLGPAPDGVWKDRSAVGELSRALQTFSKAFPNERAAPLPPGAMQGGRDHVTFKEQQLGFELRRAQGSGDAKAAQAAAKALLAEYPDSVFAPQAHAALGHAGGKAWGPPQVQTQQGWSPT